MLKRQQSIENGKKILLEIVEQVAMKMIKQGLQLALAMSLQDQDQIVKEWFAGLGKSYRRLCSLHTGILLSYSNTSMLLFLSMILMRISRLNLGGPNFLTMRVRWELYSP